MAALAVAASTPSRAVVVSAEFLSDNDCAGYFELGHGFSSCAIFNNDDTGQVIELSPVIAKTDDTGAIVATNAGYPSIDGSEFDVVVTDTHHGTFEYTPSPDDPGVKYWVVKAGDQFLLNWIVETESATCQASNTGLDNFNLACLQLAQAVTGVQDWAYNIDQGLSHLTFYDSQPVQEITSAPIPAALPLFGSALAGMGLLGWRKRRKAA